MKLHKILLTAIITMLGVFFSCQKEYSVENGAPATGTLKSNVSGDCLPSSINGVYIADTAITASNFIEVEVDVTSLGFYTIKSDTLNGYSFTDAGTFGVGGVQKVKLKGYGKPLSAGTNSFTITFGASSCILDVVVLPSTTSAANFSLGGSPNVCTGAAANGSYVAGTALVAGDSVTISVVVASAGTYSINTNTVNGISFSQSGFFSTTGPQTVTLLGAGTPVAAGANNYTVTAGTGSCTFSIDVLPLSGSAAAVFTLGGAPNSCTGFVLNGAYQAGTPLTAGNTVTLQVNVTTAGTFTITSNTVNGISFSKTGTFATAGNSQTVILTGTGTPAAAGTFNFTATAGTDNCTFSIVVVAAPPSVNTDYFPLSANSFWTYDSDLSAPDSLYYLSSSSTLIGGIPYRYLSYGGGAVGVTPVDSIAYRKTGNDYFENNYTDYYATFYFDVATYTDLPFLKENAPTGTSWSTPEFIGTTTNGTTTVTAKVMYTFTITNANTSVLVNGVNYVNVIHVSWKSKENINNAGYTDAIVYESYYAKGIGLVKFTGDVPLAPGIEVTNLLRYYKVY